MGSRILTRRGADRRLGPYRGADACAGDRQRRRPRRRVRRPPPPPARLRVHRGPPRAPGRTGPALDGVDLVAHARVGVERLPAGDRRRSSRPRRRSCARSSRRDVPLFAICFGAQVLSHALGGTVSPTPTPEIGWCDLDRRRRPPVAAGPWMEWHFDAFTVPDGFAVVADHRASARSSSPADAAWAPSSTPRPRRRWSTAGSPRAAAPSSRRAWRRPRRAAWPTTRANVVRSRPAAEALVDWFLDRDRRRADRPLAPAPWEVWEGIHEPW